MKKFSISTAIGSREINANEYSVAPKTNTFTATVKGISEFAASTAGKGKSAIPNYYLYFREGTSLYYFRSNPDEITAARASGLRVESEGFDFDAEKVEPEAPKADEAPEAPTSEGESPAEPEPETVGAEPDLPAELREAPKGRRNRARK